MNILLKSVLFFTCTLPMLALAADECKTHRNQFVDNTDYKIWSTVICPHQPVAKHTHAHPRVLIPKDNGTLRVTYADKPLGKDNPRDFKLEKDKPVYLDYNEGKDLHTDEILGDKPLTVLVIEMKTAK
ncbi:hypothetical protein [Serratia liquefaciens]|uniref:hypothetical protein n=1 Tax=Serratia liquefaciens TaxID=614 RepID=UPI0039064D14